MQTAHFESISSVDADEAEQIAGQLEQFFDVVVRVAPEMEIQIRQRM